MLVNDRIDPPESHGDLRTSRVCRAAALAVTAGSVWLAVAHQWLAFGLLLWLVPSLLLVDGRARAAHDRAKEER